MKTYQKSYTQASKELDEVFAQSRARVIANLEQAEYRLKGRLRTLYAEDDEVGREQGTSQWELLQR